MSIFDDIRVANARRQVWEAVKDWDIKPANSPSYYGITGAELNIILRAARTKELEDIALAAEELERIGNAVWLSMPQNELSSEFLEAIDAFREATK